MTLHEALCRVAKSLVAMKAFNQKLLAEMGEDPDALMFPRNKFSDEQNRQRDQMKREHETMMEGFAADPQLRQHMVPWMIDFEGDESPKGIEWDKHEKGNVDRKDFVAAVRADFGELPRKVRAWIEEHHFEISDSGSGCGGWHLGVPCSDKDAARLCQLAQDKLKVYLDAGVLTICLRFWGWRFEDVYTNDAAEEFLKARGVS